MRHLLTILAVAALLWGGVRRGRRPETAHPHLGRLRARRPRRRIQEGDRHRGRGHAVEQRGNDLQAARDRRRRLRSRAAVAGPHHLGAAGIRHLQADRSAPRSRSMSFSRRCSITCKRNTTIDGKVYALPYLWGTDGLVVNTKRATMADYRRPVQAATSRARPSMRLRRPTLMAFAFAAGKDPFALYGESEGLRRADGSGRRDAHRVQAELQVLLRQQGPAAERHPLRRGRGRR